MIVRTKKDMEYVRRNFTPIRNNRLVVIKEVEPRLQYKKGEDV